MARFERFTGAATTWPSDVVECVPNARLAIFRDVGRNRSVSYGRAEDLGDNIAEDSESATLVVSCMPI